MNKWLPEPNAHLLRRLGKTAEEASELAQAASRASIQGVAGVNPDNLKTNRQWLLEEMADVEAQVICNLDALALTRVEKAYYDDRVSRKCRQMAQWEKHYSEEPK